MKLTYQSLAEQLTGRNKLRRKIANNTYLHRVNEGQIEIRLHGKLIITYFEDGSITLDSCGWRTVTTKERMNRFAPVSVSQKNGHWSVTADTDKSWDERRFVSFADGMTLNSDQTWSGIADAKTEAEAKALTLKLKRYAHLYMTAFDAGKVPAPDSGDCWGCLMKDKDGNTAMGNNHILSHLKDNYFVPSLLLNAINRFPTSQAARWYIGSKWSTEKNPLGDNQPGFIRNQVEKSLYRYLKAEMGIAA